MDAMVRASGTRKRQIPNSTGTTRKYKPEEYELSPTSREILPVSAHCKLHASHSKPCHPNGFEHSRTALRRG